MDIQIEASDQAILEELGKRIARQRINRNFTQGELAKESGTGINTIYRIEQGYSIQLSNFIRILRALGIIHHLDQLVSYPPISPIEQIKSGKKKRLRASPRKAKRQRQSAPWKWNDES